MSYPKTTVDPYQLALSRIAAEKQHGEQARNAVKWARTHHEAAPLPNESDDDKRKNRNARKWRRRAARRK